MQQVQILAIDIGEKRIGVAKSDALGLLAHPLKTIVWHGIELFINDLLQIINQYNIEKLVVGIPYSMNGTKSERTNQVINIVEELKKSIKIPIIEIDERLTTRMAEQALHMVGKKPSRSRNNIDQIAAVYILQTYLDRLKNV